MEFLFTHKANHKKPFRAVAGDTITHILDDA
jgi:hypothetical protein